jgi:aspartyl-tRNA(Asn)/glutamyl-tRNA(Gln) amidotransferase subunit A
MAIPSAEDLALANAAGMVLSRAEAARFHTEFGTNLSACTNEVRLQLEEALELRATDFVRTFQLRGLLRERIETVFEHVDAMVMPTTKIVAPAREDADDYLLVLSETCIPWSFVDFPAISLYAGLDGHLPAGIQLVGPPASDEFLLSLAHGVEQILPKPPVWSPR